MPSSTLTSAAVAVTFVRFVVAMSIFDEPSNETPAIFLAVSNVVAVSALPVTSPTRFAVITFAEKLALPLRFTTVLAVAASVAVPPINPMM